MDIHQRTDLCLLPCAPYRRVDSHVFAERAGNVVLHLAVKAASCWDIALGDSVGVFNSNSVAHGDRLVSVCRSLCELGARFKTDQDKAVLNLAPSLKPCTVLELLGPGVEPEIKAKLESLVLQYPYIQGAERGEAEAGGDACGKGYDSLFDDSGSESDDSGSESECSEDDKFSGSEE